MAITADHIHLETIGPETSPGHDDPSRYVTVTFRILEKDHPNSFVVPVSVNIGQFDGQQIERHARYVLHHLFQTLAETTRAWDGYGRPSGPGATAAAAAPIVADSPGG